MTVDLGESGTLCNAREPAPHVNCTTTPMETLTDAVRQAFEAAAPERVTASWGHASGVNIAGVDPKTGEQYVTMVLASIISGAGATRQMDGWHACGPLCCFGALSSATSSCWNTPIPSSSIAMASQQDRRRRAASRRQRHRGEVEPIGHEMTVVAFGEGRQIPTGGAAGAYNSLPERKLGRLSTVTPTAASPRIARTPS